MNQNTTNECIPCPAGDPWITCRSKSHHRRIYYYNTVTGEAIWYLTDYENDKSKNTTKVSNEPQDCSDSYPEPSEPPQDRALFISEANEQNINNYVTSRIYDQQCNNNEPFMDHSLSPNTKFEKCDNINPLDDFTFSIPEPPTLTPNRSLSMIKQAEYKADLDYNNSEEFKYNYVHTTSVPLSKRFSYKPNEKNPFHYVMPDQDENFTAQEVSEFDFTQDEIDPLPSTQQHSIVARDLRQILSLKRRSNVGNNIEQQLYSNRAKINSNAIGTSDASNFAEHQADEINQKQFLNTSGVQNVSSKLEDCIYLVPDAIVLQKHINFLKFLLRFVDTFHFLVLENVMNDIRKKSISFAGYTRKLPQLAMTFISENIRRGFASIVKNPINVKKTGPFHLFDCCLKLVEEHEKIILLSNYKQIKNHKHADRIFILTINELKSIVNTLRDAKLIRHKLYPNETCEDVSMQHVSNEQELVSDCDLIEKKNLIDTPIKVGVGVGTSNSSEEKNTVDASVQTDLDFELLTRILNSENVKTILADSVKKETLKKENCNSSLKVWDVNINSPSPKIVIKDIDNNAKQRNFKWHRKRPRSLMEQKEEIRNSLTKDTTVPKKPIPKKKLCSEVGQIQNKCNVSVDDIPATDGCLSSAIVSATPSSNNFRSENDYTQYLQVTSHNKKSENDSNNVMFEVTSQAMYENLKSRSDEWVSRFVQIMEEALTQVLQKNPSQSPNVLAPPWTLFEATTCIKIKYRKDCDIVDAGNKFTYTLTKINDQKGTVNINLTPKQYMEMYSYGVYLIDTLQAAFEGCEDLQTASESLSKLLNDIQHPNLCTNQNDACVDVYHNASQINTNDKANRESREKAPPINVDSRHQQRQTDLSPIYSPSKRKTTSQYKNIKVQDKENDVKSFDRADSKTTMITLADLMSCHDATSLIEEESHTPLYDPPTLDEVGADKDTSPESTMNNVISTNSNNDSKQPKIFISFTQRSDYEKKLQRQALGLNYKDFDKSYFNYNNDDDYTSDEENDHYEMNGEWPNDTKNFRFDNIFNNMLVDMRRTFIIVFAFCMMYHKAINISDPERKLLEAKEVHMKINTICNVLNRIIKRDDKLFVSHIAEVLKSEDMMDDFKLEVSDLTKYREVITKYLEQANILRESLETILKNKS